MWIVYTSICFFFCGFFIDHDSIHAWWRRHPISQDPFILKRVNLVRFVGLLRGCVWSEFGLCFVTVTWKDSKYFLGKVVGSVWSVKWGVWTCRNAIRLHGMRSHVTQILGNVNKNSIFVHVSVVFWWRRFDLKNPVSYLLYGPWEILRMTLSWQCSNLHRQLLVCVNFLE